MCNVWGWGRERLPALNALYSGLCRYMLLPRCKIKFSESWINVSNLKRFLIPKMDFCILKKKCKFDFIFQFSVVCPSLPVFSGSSLALCCGQWITFSLFQCEFGYRYRVKFLTIDFSGNAQSLIIHSIKTNKLMINLLFET